MCGNLKVHVAGKKTGPIYSPRTDAFRVSTNLFTQIAKGEGDSNDQIVSAQFSTRPFCAGLG